MLFCLSNPSHESPLNLPFQILNDGDYTIVAEYVRTDQTKF